MSILTRLRNTALYNFSLFIYKIAIMKYVSHKISVIIKWNMACKEIDTVPSDC